MREKWSRRITLRKREYDIAIGEYDGPGAKEPPAIVYSVYRVKDGMRRGVIVPAEAVPEGAAWAGTCAVEAFNEGRR